MSDQDPHENCHKKVFEIYKPYFDQHFQHVGERLEVLETQTKKTNGRVNKLESLRDKEEGIEEGIEIGRNKGIRQGRDEGEKLAYRKIGKITGWIAGTGLTLVIVIGAIYNKLI